MNRIQPVPAPSAPCPSVTDPAEIAERCIELLGDESRLRAESVEAVYLPESSAQAVAALQELNAAGKTCVVSGARTGIAGAAAPIGADAVISLAKINRLLAFGKDGDEYYVRCEPGLSLAELKEILDKKTVADLPGATDAEKAAADAFQNDGETSLRFPVDPTEMTAHIGGVVSTNASGARTYRYGPTRDWVRALTVVLPDGRMVQARRGEVTADGHAFILETANGEVAVTMPPVTMPNTKATIGYHVEEGMDLVDLFVGSEGTLGMLTEVELRLAVRPEAVIGVLAVVEDEAKALALVEAARACGDVRFDAIEYFDHDTLTMLKTKKDADGAGSHIPDIPSWDGAAIYLEFSGSEDETEEACMPLEELLSGVGSSLDDTWAAMEPRELEEQKLFRHSVPEAVNTLIGQRAAQHPGLHKVGTDMAVPDDKLQDVFKMYRTGLAALELESVVFGHIGNNHVHVNLLPKDLVELKRAKGLYLDWAKGVVSMGGAVAAEHGIGRIKKPMLEIQYPPEVLDAMRALRKTFDPNGTLAPGVLV